ncbi:MAG: hypothetical protein MUE56_02330 [Ignavibacteria bacterium]|nr:hypothetical protein [Ignavibacteria bacterium]
MNTSAFTAFMNRIIDYAGMFPPAGLNLEDAFRNYGGYIKSEDEWMLSRFVCTIKTFGNFFDGNNPARKIMDEHKGDNWIKFTILLTGGNSPKEFYPSLENDLKLLRKFREENFDSLSADSFEVKLPEELHTKSAGKSTLKFLNESSLIFNDLGFYGCRMFVEPPVNNDYRYIFEKLAETIAESDHDGGNAGFKLRTGGVTPELFPSPEQIACALNVCNLSKIEFKATAGLHHPVRHYNDGVNTKMHGFLNVFGAGIFAYANYLNEREITEIINDENPHNFVFENDKFIWKDLTADTESIGNARSGFVTTFGSCSFDEPRGDLKTLGMY